MRWKLLLIASLIASVIGSGATLAIIVLLAGSSRPLASHDIIALSTLIIPIAMIIAASIFVYRHTARRRKTQAMATAVLSTILTLALILTSTFFLSRPVPQTPTPQPTKIA
jgi:membrane protein CcdC involved in cytochrome C biogenesis